MAQVPERRGIAATGPGLRGRFAGWLQEHPRAALSSLGRLCRAPVASAMTIAVIAVALALPGTLWILLKNVEHASLGWDTGTQIAVYLDPGLDSAAIDATAARITDLGDTRIVDRLSADDALAEFRELAGFDRALDALDHNPLPAVLVVAPAQGDPTRTRLADMTAQLQQIEGVDRAQVDLEWVERLHALLELVTRAITLLGILLAAGVLLIVGNTIRLDILNRRSEIEVTKLIGATDRFIRRPFLYGGFWYGFLGGAAAWLVLALTTALLSGPAARLAAAYGSPFRLSGLDGAESLALIATGTALGLIGSWLAVGRHLRAIEPG